MAKEMQACASDSAEAPVFRLTVGRHYGGSMDPKQAERIVSDRFKAEIASRLAFLYLDVRIIERRHNPNEKQFIGSMLNPELHEGAEFVLARGTKRRLFVIYCVNAGIDGLETMADDPKYVAVRDGVLKSLRMPNTDEVRRERIKTEITLVHPQFWCYFYEDFLDDAVKEVFHQVAEEQRALLQLYSLSKKPVALTVISAFIPPSIRQAYRHQLERNKLKPKE